MKCGPPPTTRYFSRVRAERLQRSAACRVLSKSDIVHLGVETIAPVLGARAFEEDRISGVRARLTLRNDAGTPGSDTPQLYRPLIECQISFESLAKGGK